MIDFPLITLALTPVILLQGSYTRKVTPRLPEPSGPREGLSGQGTQVNLLILGDSAAAGVGVNHQEEALSGQLVNQLKQHFTLSWQLHATTGHKATDTVSRLESIQAAPFDIAIISLGVNDVVGMRYSKDWLQQLETIKNLLNEKFQCRHVIFSSVPPMHLFPALPQPLRWYLGKRASRFNILLSQWLEQISNASLIALPDMPDTSYMAEDGFHPSAKGYAYWAQQISEHLLLNETSWLNSSQELG